MNVYVLILQLCGHRMDHGGKGCGNIFQDNNSDDDDNNYNDNNKNNSYEYNNDYKDDDDFNSHTQLPARGLFPVSISV